MARAPYQLIDAIRERDNLRVVFRMYGIDCDGCGLPVDWYADGVNLPCGCGANPRCPLDEARRLVAWHVARRPA